MPVVPAAEVIHQLTDLIGPFVGTVDVDDMFLVAERLLQFGDYALNIGA